MQSFLHNSFRRRCNSLRRRCNSLRQLYTFFQRRKHNMDVHGPSAFPISIPGNSACMHRIPCDILGHLSASTTLAQYCASCTTGCQCTFCTIHSPFFFTLRTPDFSAKYEYGLAQKCTAFITIAYPNLALFGARYAGTRYAKQSIIDYRGGAWVVCAHRFRHLADVVYAHILNMLAND